MLIPQTRITPVLAEPVCTARPTSSGLALDDLGVRLVGAELASQAGEAEPEHKSKGGADRARAGQNRASCQMHNLILRLYPPCLRDFQLATVSFTDGFATANYKFVSNSFSDASKEKKSLIPLQIINS